MIILTEKIHDDKIKIDPRDSFVRILIMLFQSFLQKLTQQAGEAVVKNTAPYTKIINSFGYN